MAWRNGQSWNNWSSPYGGRNWGKGRGKGYGNSYQGNFSSMPSSSSFRLPSDDHSLLQALRQRVQDQTDMQRLQSLFGGGGAIQPPTSQLPTMIS